MRRKLPSSTEEGVAEGRGGVGQQIDFIEQHHPPLRGCPPQLRRAAPSQAIRCAKPSMRRKSKSSPEDFRHPSCGRFFINCFALPAALGIPSPASRIFGRESKYPPAQSICKLRNKCRSCVRKLLAGSGSYLLRLQKNRWTYRTSTGFSPLPAAGQTLS